MKENNFSKLVIKKPNDCQWFLIIKFNNGSEKTIQIAEFTYYRDRNNNYWLRTCEVSEDYQGKEIGTFMIKKAIEEYGQVYFSNASKREFNIKYPNNGYDSRYLTEDGEEFVKGLIKNKIILSEWYRFPEI